MKRQALTLVGIAMLSFLIGTLLNMNLLVMGNSDGTPWGRVWTAISELQERTTSLEEEIYVRQVLVADIPSQDITMDQQLRPDDPTAQEGLLCTSWQVVSGSTIGPIELDQGSILFVTFDGNYNWDGNAMLLNSPFVQARIQLSMNGGPYEAVTETTLTRGNWIPNNGMDIIRRRAIPVGGGEYRIRIQHRFSVFPSESLVISAFGMSEGTISVKVLKAE